MPSNLKKRVRARMAATGEGWAKALQWVRAQQPTPPPSQQPPKGHAS